MPWKLHAHNMVYIVCTTCSRVMLCVNVEWDVPRYKFLDLLSFSFFFKFLFVIFMHTRSNSSRGVILSDLKMISDSGELVVHRTCYCEYCSREIVWMHFSRTAEFEKIHCVILCVWLVWLSISNDENLHVDQLRVI